MALRKVVSKATVTNDAYTSLVIQSHSKRSMQEQEQSAVLTKKSLEQLMESSKDMIIIRENSLFDNSTPTSDLLEKESHLEVVFVMMTNVMAEAAMVEMEGKINLLMKVVEEQDYKIVALKELMQTPETAELSQTYVAKTIDKEKNVVQESQPQQQLASVASLSIQQLQDMIVNSIRAQYGGLLQTYFIYFKPYIKRINNLRMSVGSQSPKF
ncbi:ty3-gypsy retrotransposon protein [Cucumis melo var. makuwa]|uniref:Ty3-gypsy retrotransposon protein n=1 Tax=Cucumis melo var. makuwa TaxID=1194695 RepID=A0A5D3DFP1_CUCMM|nr:ty3-gypsy retrotransposon protein [Cucumis melo var. makuwa]TYK22412.1 ty3-gypsy retrotransposon protein [Cucumis melo var. makuwa]